MAFTIIYVCILEYHHLYMCISVYNHLFVFQYIIIYTCVSVYQNLYVYCSISSPICIFQYTIICMCISIYHLYVYFSIQSSICVFTYFCIHWSFPVITRFLSEDWTIWLKSKFPVSIHSSRWKWVLGKYFFYNFFMKDTSWVFISSTSTFTLFVHEHMLCVLVRSASEMHL